MEATLALLVVTVTGYLATNVDNLLVIVAMLAAGPQSRKTVSCGFIAGSLLALAISFTTVIIADFIPIAYLNLLGIIPIIMGMKELPGLFKTKGASGNTGLQVQPLSGLFAAALATLGNSADSVAVFAPLAAETSEQHRWIIAAGFISMMAAYLWLANALHQNSLMARPIRRFGPRLTPFIMIAVGIYILLNTDTDVIPPGF